MKFKQLLKIYSDLDSRKKNLTLDERELLSELEIIFNGNTTFLEDFSLAVAKTHCSECGRAL